MFIDKWHVEFTLSLTTGSQATSDIALLSFDPGSTNILASGHNWRTLIFCRQRFHSFSVHRLRKWYDPDLEQHFTRLPIPQFIKIAAKYFSQKTKIFNYRSTGVSISTFEKCCLIDSWRTFASFSIPLASESTFSQSAEFGWTETIFW